MLDVPNPALQVTVYPVPVGLFVLGETMPLPITRFAAVHIWAEQSEGLFVQAPADEHSKAPVLDVPYPALQLTLYAVPVGLLLFGETTPLPITRFAAVHECAEQSEGLFVQSPADEHSRVPVLDVPYPALQITPYAVPVGLLMLGETKPLPITRLPEVQMCAEQSEGLFNQLPPAEHSSDPVVGDVPYPGSQLTLNDVLVGEGVFGLTAPLPITRLPAEHVFATTEEIHTTYKKINGQFI